MSNVHIAAYYANRFDPDTLFPELAIVPSADVFYGIPLTALNVREFEFEAKFDGILISALGIKDLSTDLSSNFLSEGNPSITSQVDSTIAIVSLMATIGLTYLTNPLSAYQMQKQMTTLAQPTATYSIDYRLDSIVRPFDYLTNVGFESKILVQNQYAHAGYKFMLINTVDLMPTDFNSELIPSPIFIKEASLNFSIAI